jgi:hypothetical protein
MNLKDCSDHRALDFFNPHRYMNLQIHLRLRKCVGLKDIDR